MFEEILKDVVLIFLVAVPVVACLRFLRLPPLIGFLATGVLIGPFGLGWVERGENINLLAEIGVALLLFSAGLEFTFKNLLAVRRVTIFGGTLQILLTLLAAYLIGQALGWGAYRSLFFGCIVSLSSTAVVLNSLMDNRWMEAPFGRTATGILLFQDLAFVPMMILLPAAAAFSDFALRVSVFFLLVIVLGKWGIGPLLHTVAKTRSKELFVTTLIALGLGLAWFSKEAGLSFAIGSFFAGMIISLTPYQFHALSEISPFRYTFSAIFFVAIGMLFDVRFFLEQFWMIAALMAIFPLIKVLLITGIVLLFRYSLKTAVITGLLLGQIGEFSFLLSKMGLELGIIQPYLHQLIITLIVATLFLTPFFVRIAPAVGDALLGWRWFERWHAKTRLCETGLGRETLRDHLIICGFGPLGETVGHFLDEIGRDYVILELNPMTARRHMPGKRVLLGDGASPEILERASIRSARAIAITAPDYMNIVSIIRQARTLNPGIHVITRARYRNQIEDLYAEGADVVISEELESGLEMSRYLLDTLGMDKAAIKEKIDKIREFGSADFF